jgi:hypothetical protein
LARTIAVSLPTLPLPVAARVDRVLRAERPVRALAFIAGRENVPRVADARPAGRWEPAELGVHPVAGGGPDGSMPVYVRRPHDELLRLVLDPEVAGSRLIVVRGEACARKSRAAYEAVAGRPADWPLEYRRPLPRLWPGPCCGWVSCAGMPTPTVARRR